MSAHTSERPLRLIRLQELLTLTSLSRSQAYRLLRDDPSFVKAIKLGTRSVAFDARAVEEWIADRIAQSAKARAA